MAATQGDDRVGSPHSPEHSGLLEARTDHGFAASLDHARTDKQVLAAKRWVTHPFCVPLEVVCLDANLRSEFGIGGADGAKRSCELFDLALVEQTSLVKLNPSFLGYVVIGV